MGDVTPRRIDLPAVSVFALTSLALAWLISLPLWLRGEGLSDPLLPAIAAAMMITPAMATAAALVVQRRTRRRRGARVILRQLGMWPLRPVARTIGVTVLSILAMPVLIGIGIAVAAWFGLVQLDLVTFSGYAETLRDAVGDVPLPPVALLVGLQLLLLPIAAVVNLPFALGEEVGWRGWLLPALQPLGVWPALLLSGALWGLWHAPLILLGYNFAEPNGLGVLLMVIACVLFGVILGWTRLRTGSVWPATLGHGAFNASAGLFVLLSAAGAPAPSLALVGPLGVVSWAVFAVAIGALVAAGQFRRDRLRASLAPDPARPEQVLSGAG